MLAAREQWESQQQALEEQHAKLSLNFKTATDHLSKLESESAGWQTEQGQLTELANAASQERKALESQRSRLEDDVVALQRQVIQREEDLQTAETRLAGIVADYDRRLSAATRDVDEIRNQHTSADNQLQELKQHSIALKSQSDSNEAALKKKEAEVQRLQEAHATLSSSSRQSEMELSQLREALAKAKKDVESYQNEGAQALEAQSRAEAEMRQLQSALATKTSEDEKRKEAMRRMTEQIDSLQAHTKQLQSDFNDSERLSSQSLAQMTSRLEDSIRHRDEAVKAHKEQSDSLATNVRKVAELEEALAHAHRQSASADAELQSARGKQADLERRLAAMTSNKEDLEVELQSASAQLRQQQDVALRAQRDRDSMEQQLTKAKSLLEEETLQRTTLEHVKIQSEKEMTAMQQRLARQERLCVDLQAELESLTKSLTQSRALENKTTIEHVHTLEKAMKFQDRQLAEAQSKLEDSQQLVRHLEKTKARLTGELQDVAFNSQQNTSASRREEHRTSHLEEAVARAQQSLDRERRAREVADASAEKMKGEMRSVQSQLQDALQRASHLEKTKANLQNELAGLARSPSPMPKSPSPSTPAPANGNVVNGKKQQLLNELARNNSQMTDQIEAR